MKRTDYETLAMEEIIVAMEDGFLSGSVDLNPKDEKIGIIKEHEVNMGFGDGNGVADFSGSGWD